MAIDWAGLGASLGSGVAGALNNQTGQLLQQAAHNKTVNLLERQGIPRSQAEYLATLDQSQQTPFVQAAWQYKANQTQPSELLPQMQRMSGQLAPAQMPNVQQQLQPAQLQQLDSILSGLLGNAPSPFMQPEQSPLTSGVLKGLSQLQQFTQPQQTQQQPQAPVARQSSFPTVAPEAQAIQQAVERLPKQASQPIFQSNGLPTILTTPPKVARTVEEALAQVEAISPKELADRRKVEHKARLDEEERLRKVSQEEQDRIQKETLPFYNEQLEADKAAKDSEKRLGRMKKLIDKGDLPFSTFYKLFKNLEEHVSPTTGAAIGAGIGGLLGGAATIPAGGVGGLVLSPLGGGIGAAIGGAIQPVATLLRSVQQGTSPDTDEFEKLSNDFIRDAKGIFGSRITDADLRAFLQMVPTLSQTDRGKKAVIRNMENFMQAVHVRTDAMKDIIKENRGLRPANLQILVDERAGNLLDKLSQDYVEGLDSATQAVQKTPTRKQIMVGGFKPGSLMPTLIPVIGK